MPLLSIIIPVYNVEKYLGKCLDSVICPELPDYDIIVVNDGSTDSSPAIAERYAQSYPELIRLVSKENGGLGSARNAGLQVSESEFVLFLDSDDYLEKGAVAQILTQADSGFDIGIFDFVPVDESGRKFPVKKGCQREGCFEFSQFPQLLFETQSACNKIFRRSLFKDKGIEFPGRIWFEDLSTTPKLYLHCDKIKYIPRCWYNYLIRPGSITNSANIEKNLDMLTAFSMVTDYYKEQGAYEKYKNELEYMGLYNELITSTTRVNLADRKSPVQEKLLDYFLESFPDWEQNPYIQNMAPKLKLLFRLILKKDYLAVNRIMRLNNLIKGK